MVTTPGDDEKIAEVRDALAALQALTADLEEKGELQRSVTVDTARWKTADPSDGSRALVRAELEQPAPSPSRTRPILIALATAGAATAGVVIYLQNQSDSSEFLAVDGAPSAVSAVGDAGNGSVVATAATTAVLPKASVTDSASSADAGPVTATISNTDSDTATSATASLGPSTNRGERLRDAAPVQGPQNPIADAKSLLGEGQVIAARRVLNGAKPRQNPDAAWLLARSYDPRYLKTLARPDAAADAQQAAAWYRVWHAESRRQGLVSRGMNVEKLIRSMN